MKEKFEYYIVLLFIKLAKILPLFCTYKLLYFFGFISYCCFGSRRNIAIKNLSLVFSEKPQKEIKALAKENFISIAQTVAEILILASGKKEPSYFVKDEEEASNQLKTIMKNEKSARGVIFITAHFGNWEILPSYFASKGSSFLLVGREGNNKLIEKRLTKAFRERHGNENVHKSLAMTKMIKTLKNGGRVGIVIDQKAGNTNSTKTTFFGKECMTTISVATMKLKYDPLVIPVFALRNNDGKFSFIVGKPIEYMAQELETKEDKITAMTQKYNDALEEVVKEYPAQWFWMHNRWKM